MKKKYKDQNVLILGLGINQGGLGATRFFAEQEAHVRVTDLKDETMLADSLDQLKKYSNIEYILGEHRFQDIDWADLVIRNPALKPDNTFRKYAEESGKRVEMDMGIFLEYIKRENVIGITGTKGKSTTSSLIYYILKEAGKDVIFAGNIGKSILDSVPYLQRDTLAVLELSSFMLEAWEQHNVSPHLAVVTNIFPDHLDYYGDMQSYIEAKKVIAKYQTDADVLFVPEVNPLMDAHEFVAGIQTPVETFSAKDIPDDMEFLLLGEHNKANFAAAMHVTRHLGISEKEALHIMQTFKGVEFRMQLIKDVDGIKIYNDTAATGPDSAEHSLRAFPHPILITGGVNKGLPYEQYARAIDTLARSVYFIEGSATDELKRLMREKVKIKGSWDNFDELLAEVHKEAESGDTILFSPGGSSFNLFQNEFDRGRKFNEAVNRIFNNEVDANK